VVHRGAGNRRSVVPPALSITYACVHGGKRIGIDLGRRRLVYVKAKASSSKTGRRGLAVGTTPLWPWGGGARHDRARATISVIRPMKQRYRRLPDHRAMLRHFIGKVAGPLRLIGPR
jgi:hypothetical protein